MYDQQLGAALNYGGQNNIPGKGRNVPQQQGYMGYQLQQYGRPKRGGGQQQPMADSQGGTPVMPNGQVQPPMYQQGPSPQQAQPQAQQQPQQPAAQPPGSPGAGWVNVGGGWYPPDHPVAQQQVQQQKAQAGQQQNPMMGNAGSVDANGVYHAGTAPTATYQAQGIPQFQAPNLSGINNQQGNLISQLLQNPNTVNIDQLKGQNQDQASQMGQQQLDQLRQQFASRGRSLNSGQELALERQVGDQTNQNILGGNRQLDIQGAQQNRNDVLNALGAAQGFGNSTLGQAVQGYQTNLAGLGANQGEQLAQLNSIYQPFQLNTAMQQAQAGTQQGAIGNNNQGQSIANQLRLGLGSQDLNQQTLDFNKFNTNRQFDYSAGQDAAASSRYYDNMAMQYQQGQDAQYNSLLEYLIGGGQQ